MRLFADAYGRPWGQQMSICASVCVIEQPEFAVMREQYMRTGEGFVICYSVTDRHTFNEATAYKRLVDRLHNSDDMPVVLVGNKCDLQLERQVRMVLYLSCLTLLVNR